MSLLTRTMAATAFTSGRKRSQSVSEHTDKEQEPQRETKKPPQPTQYVWERLTCGVRVQDLHEKRFHEALCFLNEYFIREETLCQACKLSEDPVSVVSFLDTVKRWMSNKYSLCAIEEGSGVMVGLLVMRRVNRLEQSSSFSRIKLMQRESFIKVMDFHFYMNNRIDVFEHFNVESFLRNYGICVSLKYRGKGVSESLIRCGINYMQRLGLTVMEGLFTSERYSRLARKMGFQVLYSKPYSSWMEDRKIIFPTLAEGGGSAFIMAAYIQA